MFCAMRIQDISNDKERKGLSIGLVNKLVNDDVNVDIMMMMIKMIRWRCHVRVGFKIED